MSKDQIGTLEFTTAELRSLPMTHCGFLVSSCIAVDDIGLMQKLLLLSLNSGLLAKSDQDTSIQTMAYAARVAAQRNLSTKILEYLNMLAGYLTKSSRSRTDTMRAFRGSAGEFLERAKGTSEYQLAKWYRNTVTNHYLSAEVGRLVAQGDLGSPETVHAIYLHEKDGNSSYALGEQVLLAKLSEGGQDPVKTIESQDSWTLSMTRKVAKLHSEFCIELMETYFPEKTVLMRTLEIDGRLVGGLTDTYLPVLWRMGPAT